LLAQDGEAGPPLFACKCFKSDFGLKVNLIVNVTLFLGGWDFLFEHDLFGKPASTFPVML